MSLTQKLDRLQLGLIRPSTFRDSLLYERLSTLRQSANREVVTAWTSDEAVVDDDGRYVPSGYNTLDIDNTDNRYLLAGCFDGSVEIFDLDPISQSPKQRCKRVAGVKKKSQGCHESHCNWVQWYPRDNGLFITSGQDKCVKVWDTNELAVVETFRFERPVFMHHFHDDSRAVVGQSHTLIAVASDESNVRLVDLRTGGKTQHLRGHKNGGVMCVQWSPYDSNLLVSGGRDGCVFLWDVRSGKSFLTSLQPPPMSRNARSRDATHQQIAAIKFTPAQESFRLVTVDICGVVRIWDALTCKFLFDFKVDLKSRASSAAAVGIDFACNGGRNHSAGGKQSGAVMFLPAGTNVAVVDLDLSDGGSRVVRKTLSGHMMRVAACVYRGHDYQELYSASADKTIGCFRPARDDNLLEFTAASADAASFAGGRDHRTVEQLTQDDWSD